jgi:uncharacterized protein YndB with AHSA1/START domain
MTTQPSRDDRVVIERVVSATREVVWEMWADPKHFAEWYGPSGATIPVAEFDLRPGGERRVCMAMDTPNGPMRMWFGGHFEEIEPPARLVYTEYVADEHGEPVAAEMAGMPADHPTVTTIIVALEDLGERTRMKVTHVGIPEGSPGAMGWNMALDKLEAALTG